MKENRKVQFKKRSLSFGAILGIVFLIYLVFESGEKTIENIELKNCGVYTKGVIFERYSAGAKGDICSAYFFYYGNNKFYGKSYDDSKVKIGDTVIIVFLKSNPNINRSNSLLKLSKLSSP